MLRYTPLRILASVSRYKKNYVCKIDKYKVEAPDLLSLYIENKDIFVNQIYGFTSTTEKPRILDCGGYIGMSTLYFKKIYPKARITTFEPDPNIFQILKRNVERNNVTDVELVNSAVSKIDGTLKFDEEGSDGGSLIGSHPNNKQIKVKSCRLSSYLKEPVDLLKMNIEGAEWEVFQEIEYVIHNVDQIIFEYHHFTNLKPQLHNILTLLDRNGFSYIINHFDYETNGAVKPPLKISKSTTYFLLVHARKLNDKN
ncbi:FkbM family methyltransferase [Methanosarcina sp. 2.H.A.1B.4]|uniref:FkbM family methyltransferase n=1 Tax=Methanosarcina sp. 2.H.A.1B.4 TaxID=1483600 RepID=UPI00138DFE23|nr:FkbM family methyltransferase [Methanosarcina sp. 2.H.A.1B.4]